DATDANTASLGRLLSELSGIRAQVDSAAAAQERINEQLLKQIRALQEDLDVLKQAKSSNKDAEEPLENIKQEVLQITRYIPDQLNFRTKQELQKATNALVVVSNNAIKSAKSQQERNVAEEVSRAVHDCGERIVRVSPNEIIYLGDDTIQNLAKEIQNELIDVKFEVVDNTQIPGEIKLELANLSEEEKKTEVETEHVAELAKKEIETMKSFSSVIPRLRALREVMNHILTNQQKFAAAHELPRIKQMLSDVQAYRLTSTEIIDEYRHIIRPGVLERIKGHEPLHEIAQKEHRELAAFEKRLRDVYRKKYPANRGLIETLQEYIDRIGSTMIERNKNLDEAHELIDRHVLDTDHLFKKENIKDIVRTIQGLEHNKDYWSALQAAHDATEALTQYYDHFDNFGRELQRLTTEINTLNKRIRQMLNINKAMQYIGSG
ncbi:MAG: hypothetical protein AABX52_01050, partial [Nanoarchaeota archaeon]